MSEALQVPVAAPGALPLLTSVQMATFVARGFLRFDAVVPDAINRRFLADIGDLDGAGDSNWRAAYARAMRTNGIPEVRPGMPLATAYPAGSPIADLLDLPLVRGALHSLVGPDPLFDHHFLHITFPRRFYPPDGPEQVSQHTHQDSTIDPRLAFDVQVMYFPHDVTADMGGTRFVPGTHLHKVSEVAIGRYQNIRGQQHMVCPAGTLLFLHHGIWHGGGLNRSERTRSMFKIRINPQVPQQRLWDTRDLPAEHAQRPIFWVRTPSAPDDIDAILMKPEPWFEADTGRLEFLNRIRLWRHLLGEPAWDADYWLTRVENQA